MGPGAFRFILAAVVLLEHIHFPVQLGGTAVFLFFTLSGYWITRVLQSRYLDMPNGMAIFVIARLWRLYPAFLIATLATALVREGSLSGVGLEHLSLFAGNGWFKYMQVAWSLVIEVQFYLFAPILALALRNKQANAYALAGVLAWSAYAWLNHQLGFAAYAPFFVIGAVSASLRWTPSRASILSGAACAVLAFAWFAFRTDYVFRFEHVSDGFLAQAANGIVALCLAPLAIRSATLPGNRVDGFLGDMSYSLYLAHWPIVNNIGGVLLMLPAISIPLKSVVFSLIASVALYWAERPFETWRSAFLRRVEKRRPAAALTQPVAAQGQV